MKKLICFSLILLSTAILFSCTKREESCEGCINGNKPPISIAGPDEIIYLPTDSIFLDGSASNDQDGTISEWLWKKISGGPSSFNIVSAATAKTAVRNLDRGVYLFQLMIRDNGGLSANDTIQITVNDPSQPNRPPVANAGTDQTISLPANTIELDGIGSSDLDNNITKYLWTKISGPLSFSINNAGAVEAEVGNLVEGVYLIELRVTDAGGLYDMDTVQVTVLAASIACNTNTTITACDGSSRPVVCAQLTLIGTLSEARGGISVASAGNKIVFAGGGGVQGSGVVSDVSSRIDIYDIAANAWSIAELTAKRGNITAVASGNKLFFAGGVSGISWWDWLEFFSNVDIYDVSTNGWASEHIKPARVTNSATAGNKVVFAGEYGYNSCGSNCYTWGEPTNAINIYDIRTNTWATALLSEARWEISAVSLGDRIYFAGGYLGSSALYSNKIDIYDAAANMWSIAALSEPREIGDGGIAAGNKIFWAGGSIHEGNKSSLTCKVEIFDVNTQTTSFANLSQPGYVKAVLKDHKVVFLKFSYDAHSSGYSRQFDIYDLNTSAWSVGVLPEYLPGGAAIISVNNTIYLAGGWENGSYSNQVWKLEF